MIDTKELRRLAQAATPGPWINHGRQPNVAGLPHSAVAAKTLLARVYSETYGDVEQETANASFITAANPAAISELLDHLEATEKDRSNFIVEIGRLCAQCDALRAKIEAMEKQEPVAWLHESRRDSDVVTSAVKHVWGKAAVGSMAAYSIPLYLAPGAQPTPSIPEGWKKELFCIQHAMAMNNWDWKSDASNDMKRAAYAAVVRLRAAASEAKP